MKLTVKEAADYLGISENAVRLRISRGTLNSKKKKGVRYVIIDKPTEADTPDDRSDETRQEETPPSDSSELVTELRNQISYLKERIATLERLLDQQQQITMVAEQKQLPEAATIDTEVKENVTPGWLRAKIFRRASH